MGLGLPSYRYEARHISSLGYLGDLFPPKLVEFKGATERKVTEHPIQILMYIKGDNFK